MNDAAQTSREGSWAGVAFGICIAAFAAYHQFKLPVVLPVLLERYGYERTLAGAFVSVYAVAGLLLSVWMGRLVQRRGAVFPVLLAMGLLIAGSIVSLVAPALGMLVLAGRALEGVAFAALAVVGPVIASANAPPRQLGLVIGMIAGWIPLGQLSATLLAHLGVSYLGWTFLWWLGIGGAVLVALWTVALARTSSVVLRREGATGASVRRGIAPDQRTTLIMTGAVFMAWSGQYFAFMTWLPQYMVEVHAVDMHGALLGYMLPILFVLTFNVLAGIWLRGGTRIGTVLLSALALQSLVWWLLPVAGSNLWLGAALLVVYGASAGAVPTCLFAMPSSVLGADGDTASGFGLIMTGRNLGVLIGPVLLAWLVGEGGRWTGAQLAFAVITAIALGVAVGITSRLRRHHHPSP